ncbi:MAG TPA: ABC transporter substrate-binding protein, partial [Rubrivivax sp.]|nr:ABC transporter substrate-binding protein [Rubrivivax sp.]
MPAIDNPAAETVVAIAPTGVLRAAINLGNPILASADGDIASPTGVSVDLARELAGQLGLPMQPLVFKTAGQAVDAVTNGEADIGFFAVDPLRGAGIAFSPPYVLIEGCYLVSDDSPLQDNHEVDRPGVRVVVGSGSAYDLYLSRTLKSAEIVRAPSSQTVVATFVEQRLEVAAGVKQQLTADAQNFPGHRLLPGRFMLIQQAMGLSKGRGLAAHALLARFVEDMKAS